MLCLLNEERLMRLVISTFLGHTLFSTPELLSVDVLKTLHMYWFQFETIKKVSRLSIIWSASHWAQVFIYSLWKRIG
jgi:hypothetical protein